MSNSSITLLNKYFKVISYNGGSINGPSGVHHLLNLDANQLHSTRNGKNFDLVLEYTGPNNTFTLTNYVNKGFEFKLVTAPLKTTVVWVSDEPTLANKDAYNDVSAARVLAEAEQFAALDAPTPALIATTNMAGTDAIACVPSESKANVTGKYLHIKFTERYGSDVNIDMGHFAIVGYPGAPDAQVWKNESKMFTPSPSDYKHLFAHEITRPVVIAGIPNPLHAAFIKNIITSVPIICFVSQIPTNQLDGEVSDAAVAEAYAAFRRAAAHPQAAQIAFVTVGPDTDRSLARFTFQHLGLPYDHIVDDDTPGTPEDNEGMETYLAAEKERERLSGYAIIESEMKTPSYPAVGAAALQTTLGTEKPYAIVALSAEVDEELYVYHLSEQKEPSIDTFVEQFIEAYEPQTDTEELLGSTHFDTAINAAVSKGLLEAKQDPSKLPDMLEVDFGTQVNKARECKLTPHVFSTARFEGDRHPLLPNVYIGVHSNFDELVLNHPDPVLLATISGGQFDLYAAAHVCAFARLLTKYAPASGPASKLRIVLWNIRDDDLPEAWEDKFSVCDYIVKLAPAKDQKTRKARQAKYGSSEGVNSAGLEIYVESLVTSTGPEDDDDIEEDFEGEGGNQEVPLVSTILERLQEPLQLPKGKLLKPFELDAKKAEAALENLNAITDGGKQALEMIQSSLLPRRRFNSAANSPLVELKNTAETAPSVALIPDPATPFGEAFTKLSAIRSAAHELLYTLPFPLGRLPLQRAIALSKGESEQKQSVLNLDILAVADRAVKLRSELDTLTEQFNGLMDALEQARGRYKAFLGLFDSFSDAIADLASKNQSKLWSGFLVKFARLVRATGMPVYTFSSSLTSVFEAEAGMTVERAYEQALPYHAVTPTSIREAVKPLDAVYKEALGVCTTLAEQTFDSKLPTDLCLVAKTAKEVMRVVEGYVNPKAPVVLKGKPGAPKPKGPPPKVNDPKVPNANERLVVVLIHSVDDGSVSRIDEIVSQMRGALAQVEEYNMTQQELEAKGEETGPPRAIQYVRARGDKCPELMEVMNVTTLPAVCYLQASSEHSSFRIEGISGLSEFALNIDAIFQMEEEALLDEDEDLDEDLDLEEDDQPE